LNEFEGLESFSITDILSRTTTLSLPTSY
jgi:hypothetical protein